MEIGNQIKKYRGKLKWSQETLAQKSYVSPQTISDWENGNSYPDIHSLLILSKLFNISLDKLIKEDVEAIKKEIESNNAKKFNSMTWLLAAEYIVSVVSAVPLMKYLSWIGGIIWGLLLAFSIITALKAEKLKKASNIRTYREIKAFMEGKPLEDIKNERLKAANKPVIKAVIGVVLALLTCTVMTLILF